MTKPYLTEANQTEANESNYLNDGHGIIVGGDDNDAGILTQRRLQVPDEDAEEGHHLTGGHAPGAGQRPLVVAARPA